MEKSQHSFFATTRWTLVGEASCAGDSQAKEALGVLFSTYWKPLYRYARRTGKGTQDAEDLVQSFFTQLLEGNGLELADRDRGRFRAFLLGALKNHMVNAWRHGHRRKRGGFAQHLSLDWQDAESGLVIELEDRRSPDRLYDREWAMALLDKVLGDLEREEPGFVRWKPFLSLSREHLSYSDLAEQFEMSEGAARVAVHRLRKRYRQRVRSEIAGSLDDASMVDEEMKVLFDALVDDFS